jgi:hypothetical protein
MDAGDGHDGHDGGGYEDFFSAELFLNQECDSLRGVLAVGLP